MKTVIVILLTVFAGNSSMADTSALPTYEQAVKLVAAAWKSATQSIDVTYYMTVKDNTRTKEKLRKIYEEAFDKEYGPDEDLTSDMLERKERDIQINVEGLLAEQQQGGRKVKYRVRADGNSYRVDRVYGRPQRTIRTILKGIAREEFLPGKKLDANTPFEETFIETPSPTNGFECYTYFHGLKVAEIEKIEHSRTAVEDRKINRILKMPNAPILQMKLGTRMNKLATEPYDINEPKIEQLCSGTLEGIRVEIRPDPNEPDAKDRIEISLYNDEKIEVYTSLMICEKDDYSKVYYCQTPNPASNKPPIFTRACSNFDAQGFAHNVTEVRYDGKGKVKLCETYKIENVRLNIPIPKEVFQFNPPEDYIVTDFRLTAAERRVAKIEGLKRRLKGKDRGRKLEALVTLREYLKDKPDEMRKIAISILEDEHYNVRFLAFGTLIPLLKDNPEKLRHIATSMLDDEDPRIQRMAARILRRIESKKEGNK